MFVHNLFERIYKQRFKRPLSVWLAIGGVSGLITLVALSLTDTSPGYACFAFIFLGIGGFLIDDGLWDLTKGWTTGGAGISKKKWPKVFYVVVTLKSFIPALLAIGSAVWLLWSSSPRA